MQILNAHRHRTIRTVVIFINEKKNIYLFFHVDTIKVITARYSICVAISNYKKAD